MTDRLTDDQRREVRFLMDSHHYTHEEALLAVTKTKVRVRAPTMEELENLKHAARRKQPEEMKCSN